MLPEGRFFDRVSQRGPEREERGRRGPSEGSKYRFAIGLSDQDKPGTVGYQAVNRALDVLGVEPSMAFVAISRAYEENRTTILTSIRNVIGDIPVIGSIVPDPIIHREGVTEGRVAVALWAADEDVEIRAHRIKIHNVPDEEIREILLKRFEGSGDKRFLNVFGVAPYFFEGIGDRLENVFLSLSEYIDLAVVGVMGGYSPSPWSILVDDEFLSSHIALLTIKSNHPLGIFFAYGFHPLVPMEITRSEGNYIVELDHSPAHEVLTDILLSRGINGADLKDRSKLRKILSRFQIALPDPAAAGRFKAITIKDITHRGIEVSIGTVEGSTVWLMEADNVEVLKSTVKGAMKSLASLKGSRAAGMIFFENHLRIKALGEDIKRDTEGLKQAIPLPFLGVPSAQELVIHHTVLSGLHSGVAAGMLFANSPEKQP